MPDIPVETDEEKEARRTCEICHHFDGLLAHLVDVNQADPLTSDDYWGLSEAIARPRDRHEASAHPAWSARIKAGAAAMTFEEAMRV